jgi:hypothetical protein
MVPEKEKADRIGRVGLSAQRTKEKTYTQDLLRRERQRQKENRKGKTGREERS